MDFDFLCFAVETYRCNEPHTHCSFYAVRLLFKAEASSQNKTETNKPKKQTPNETGKQTNKTNKSKQTNRQTRKHTNKQTKQNVKSKQSKRSRHPPLSLQKERQTNRQKKAGLLSDIRGPISFKLDMMIEIADTSLSDIE